MPLRKYDLFSRVQCYASPSTCRRQFALAAVILALVSFASILAAQAAGAPTPVSIPECVTGKLADYEKLGPLGCRIGDIQFSDFSRSKSSTGLLGRAISVTPGTAIDSTDPALLLEARGWVKRRLPV
jgi:hypothetical protein